MFGKVMRGVALLAGLAMVPVAAGAEEFDDGQIAATRAALAGKRVGFIPLSMGVDLGQVWSAALQRDADRFGYEIIIRDANWSVEAGAQALNELIGEHVDLIVLHSVDQQAYVRLVDKANREGIPVVQVNMKSPNTGGAYVGVNYYAHAQMMGQAMYDFCAPENGGNGKIAMIPGPMTSPGTYIIHGSLEDFYAEHPGLEVVADQPADYDSNKAMAATATILKQHPDLCGVMGIWEVGDMGISAAIKEAGLQGKVKVVSSGGGEVKASCNNVANGNFDALVSFEAREVGAQLSTVVLQMLQTPPEDPGAQSYGIYTQSKLITKDNAGTSCWDLEMIQKNGF